MNYWKEVQVIRHQLKELPSKTDAFAAIIHGARAIKENGTWALKSSMQRSFFALNTMYFIHLRVLCSLQNSFLLKVL